MTFDDVTQMVVRVLLTYVHMSRYNDIEPARNSLKTKGTGSKQSNNPGNKNKITTNEPTSVSTSKFHFNEMFLSLLTIQQKTIDCWK